MHIESQWLDVPPPGLPETGAALPQRQGQRAGAFDRRSSWLDEASASPAPPVPPRAASGAPATSTTRASSRCSPAPCARSRQRAERGRVRPAGRTKFQVVALLVREERARVKADEDHQRRPSAPSSSSASTGSRRSWRRPPPATPRCSPCSPRTPSCPTRPRRSSATCCGPPASSRPRRRLRRPSPWPPAATTERRVVPQSVVSRQLANPFLAPDFSSAASARGPRPGRLASWELLGPLFTVVRVRRRSLVVHGPARADLPAGAGRPGADAAPGPAGRRRRGRPPDLPARRRARAWARRPRRCSPPRPRTPTRCSSSYRTSSRPTGPARPVSGPPTAPPP